MKKLTKILFFTLCINFLAAQSPCDGRYAEEIFDDVQVTTVTYSDVHNLQMDIYQPVGDLEPKRPLIIFAHGGTFIFGSKKKIVSNKIKIIKINFLYASSR